MVVWCRDLLKHLAVVISWLLSKSFPSLVWVSGEGVTVSGCTIMWLTCRPTVLSVLKYPSFNYHSPVSLSLPVSLSVFVCLPVCVCLCVCLCVLVASSNDPPPPTDDNGSGTGSNEPPSDIRLRSGPSAKVK